jgi:hypothetical protein
MSGAGMNNGQQQRPGEPRPNAAEVVHPKPQIISSTSFFIAAKIQENSTENRTSNGIDVDVEKVLTAITLEMRSAMVAPASHFESAEQLVNAYGEGYCMQHLSPNDKLLVASAYLEGVAQAKREERYFGRNPNVIENRFRGNQAAAVNAFVEFALRFGYEVRDLNIGRSDNPEYVSAVGSDGKVKPEFVGKLFSALYFYYNPAKHLVHRSENVNVSPA